MRRLIGLLVVVTLVLGLSAGQSAQADLLLFHSALSPHNEIQDPPVISDAAGAAVMAVDPATGDFDLTMWVSGLTEADLAVNEAGRFHIHIGGPDVNGPVIFQFAGLDNFWSTGGPGGQLLVREIVGANLGQSFMEDYWDDLLAGDTYLNLHTQAYPAGEIRGQLVLIPEPASLGLVAMGAAVLLMGRRRRMV